MCKNTMKDVYQKLYDSSDYGRESMNLCPGARLIPHYKHFLRNPIVDLGCGSGDTVARLIRNGYKAKGVDWVQTSAYMEVGDITEPLPKFMKGCQTVLCMDVLEHIERDSLEGLLDNLALAKSQIVSVHCGSSKWEEEGEELHITQLSFKEWEELFFERFQIKEMITLQPKIRALYLMQTRT